MPTFDTPDPIAVTVDLPIGGLRIVASERADTTVEVGSSPGDRAYADSVTVDLVAGELKVTGPKLGLRTLLVPTPGRSIEVEIGLPAGSSLSARTVYGAITVEGVLDHCRAQAGYGDVRIGDAASVELLTSYGQVHAGDVAGDAVITADHGDVRVERVGGTATVQSRHGAVRLGEVVGETQLSGSHGDMDVEYARGSVAARTAHGTVRLGRVVRGDVTLTSTHGRLEVGVDPASAVWLDADTRGRIRNGLEARQGPEGFAESVAILARSSDGDVVVRRA